MSRVPGSSVVSFPEHLPDGGDAAQHPTGVEGEEDLGRLTVGDLLQRLEISDGDQVGGRVAVVDGAKHPLDGLALAFGHREQLILLGVGYPLDRLGLSRGLEDLALLDAFGP